MKMLRFIFVFLSFVLIVLSLNENSDNSGLKISTTLGEIEGLKLKDGKVKAFLGIPFAESPFKKIDLSLQSYKNLGLKSEKQNIGIKNVYHFVEILLILKHMLKIAYIYLF
jgi:hypothetical protein